MDGEALSRVGWFIPCEKRETWTHLADMETGWVVGGSVSKWPNCLFHTSHCLFKISNSVLGLALDEELKVCA